MLELCQCPNIYGPDCIWTGCTSVKTTIALIMSIIKENVFFLEQFRSSSSKTKVDSTSQKVTNMR